MKKIALLLLSTLIVSVVNLRAQDPCGTMDFYNTVALKEQLYRTQDMADKYMAKQLGANLKQDTITIPVVVHIVYNGSSQNISDSRVAQQIAVLNKDFARLNTDANNTPSAFKPFASGIPIKFCLAVRDPNGDPTTGITRDATTKTSFGTSDNNAVKHKSTGGSNAWPSDQYLNIWACNLGGSLLGYAQFPGDGQDPTTDGVVIHYQTIGLSGGFSGYELGRTTTHEVGHWLGLLHTWGDDDGGLANLYCSEDDRIEDTPKEAKKIFGCPSFPTTDVCTTVGNGVMYMDYMDYTNDACKNMYTIGQVTRMTGILNTSRKDIRYSNGCIDPENMLALDAGLLEVNDPVGTKCSNSFSPLIKVKNYGTTTITNIDFEYATSEGIYTYKWNGSLTSLNMKDITLPSFSIDPEGSYILSVTIKKVNDADDDDISNNTLSSSFEIKRLTALHSFSDGFEGTIEPPYEIINADKGVTWTKTNRAKKTGVYSLYFPSYYYPENGVVDEFVLPAVNFSNVTNQYLTFDRAYALYSETGFSDTLEIYVQNNCGLPWTRIYRKSYADLTTAPQTTKDFIPNSTQWKHDSISLASFTGDFVHIKFTARSDFENNLYIDNINVKGVVTTGINQNLLTSDKLRLFPNPSSGQFFMEYTADKNSDILVTLSDVTGRKLGSYAFSTKQGINTLQIEAKDLPKGYVLVTLMDEGNAVTQKMIIQ